ncbi:MAG: hypothetical protein J5477_02035 [Schwartzia sp.]|nr:hypothetical protein [Schwartzia sp. (in: firmicutes)]MBR5163137.1 hypothetical protein [Schwartzia sp. (in: firmicutes)]
MNNTIISDGPYNMNPLLHQLFSALVNQSIINQRQRTVILPKGQQEALNKILEALHDFNENWSKIEPAFKPIAFEESILKIASEIGWIIERNQP